MADPGYPTVQAEGFELGMFVSYGECGDAWVRAPEGGIAGLIWETGSPEYFRMAIEPDPADRQSTFAVQLDLPMTTSSEAEAYLRAFLPRLIPYWHAWADSRQRGRKVRSSSVMFIAAQAFCSISRSIAGKRGCLHGFAFDAMAQLVSIVVL